MLHTDLRQSAQILHYFLELEQLPVLIEIMLTAMIVYCPRERADFSYR